MTGASGFVGRVLCRQLDEEEASIRVLLRNPAGVAEFPTNFRAAVAEGDLMNAQSLRQACANIDCIIHVAGLAHVGSAARKGVADSNLIGSRNLIDAAIGQGVKRIVFLSSTLADSAESGSGDVTDYGKAKLAVEQLLAGRADAIESVIVRAVNVYGIGMKGNIAKMIDLIGRGRLPRLPTLSSRISLIGVEDLSRALILAMKSNGAAGQTYTVTDSESYSINSIERAIYEAYSKALPRWRTPAVVLYVASVVAGFMSNILGGNGGISRRTYRNLTMDNLFDNSTIRESLGFAPSTSFYKELPKIVLAAQENKIQEGKAS